MKLAKVIGNVVSTIKTASHHQLKLMVLVPVDKKWQPNDTPFIAIDDAQAGIGDTVLVLEEGGSARQLMENKAGAFDAIIIGVVDKIES